MFKSLTKLKGENVECLRVREAKPDTKKPILSDKNPNWSKVIQAVKSGAYSIEDLRIKYEITEKVKEQILNECLKKENEKV